MRKFVKRRQAKTKKTQKNKPHIPVQPRAGDLKKKAKVAKSGVKS
jgi:hypothetical protein